MKLANSPSKQIGLAIVHSTLCFSSVLVDLQKPSTAKSFYYLHQFERKLVADNLVPVLTILEFRGK